MKKNIYTDDFKKQIVALQKNGKSINDLITEYGLSRSTVFKWVHQARNSGSFRTKDNRTAEQKEIIALQKENKNLKIENEILKRAALIMAKKIKVWNGNTFANNF